ncbi:hypothetical protein [Streptomyces sp. NPDC012825]|uniref:hypothetical protein n=1 Tax=Streptomyces sp. NPDC012825 TaxID=3364851 RepID=UPI00368C56F0
MTTTTPGSAVTSGSFGSDALPGSAGEPVLFGPAALSRPDLAPLSAEASGPFGSAPLPGPAGPSGARGPVGAARRPGARDASRVPGGGRPPYAPLPAPAGHRVPYPHVTVRSCPQ